MSPAVVLALVGVAVTGTAVAFTRDPLRAVVVYGVFGTMLAVLFFVLDAPDVALSELAVGTLAVSLLTLIAISKTTRTGR